MRLKKNEPRNGLDRRDCLGERIVVTRHRVSHSLVAQDKVYYYKITTECQGVQRLDG